MDDYFSNLQRLLFLMDATKKSKGNTRPQSYCVFCGGSDLSKEHLWPEWMHPLLPQDASNLHFSDRRKRNFVEGYPAVKNERFQHRGPIRARKFRAFCRTCNSSWMSSIEDRAKFLLEDLMKSKSMILTKADIEKIATWFSLKTMVYEFAGDPASYTVPKNDYDYIRTHKLPPPHWRIWIGSQNAAEWIMRCYNLPTTVVLFSDLPFYEKSEAAPKCNMLTSSFGLGQLFAHVGLSNAPKLLTNHDAAIDNSRTPSGEPLLYTLWPYSGDLVWPRSFFLSNFELSKIAETINLVSQEVPAEYREVISVGKE